MNIQPTAMPSLATVGPLPQSTTPPVLFEGHHGCSGGDKSSTKSKPSRALLPKKERLRLGRERDKRRVAALRSQLLRSESAASTPLGENSKYVLQTVAAEAAAAAAALGCIRHQASDEQADAIATAVHSAVMALATIDVLGRESISSGEDSESSAVHASAAENTARNEHPGSEAVASEAPGLVLRPDTVATLGTVPVLNSASPSACILLEGNRRGEVEVGVRELRQLALHDPLEDLNFQDLATTAGPVQFEIFEAADFTWLCSTGDDLVDEPVADATSADAAAGVSASAGLSLECHQHHREHNPSKIGQVCGGGTSVTTLMPVAAVVSLATEPDDVIPGSLQPATSCGARDSCAQDGGVAETSSSMGTPGSSRPGSQNGAHGCFSKNVVTGKSACEEMRTGEIALPGWQCGHRATASHSNTFGAEAVASAAPGDVLYYGTLPTEASVRQLEHFNSHDLATQFGPLPTHAYTAGAVDSMKTGSAFSRQHCGPLSLHGGEDFNSQTLANQGGPVVLPVNAHVAVGLPASALSTQQRGPLPQHGGVDLHSQTLASPDGYVSLPVKASSVSFDADTTTSVVGQPDDSESIVSEQLTQLKNLSSQNLANTCEDVLTQHAPPELFGAIPEPFDSYSGSEPLQAQPVLHDANTGLSLPEPLDETAGEANSNTHGLDANGCSATDVQVAEQHVVHPVGSDAAIQACMRELQASVNLMFMQSSRLA